MWLLYVCKKNKSVSLFHFANWLSSNQNVCWPYWLEMKSNAEYKSSLKKHIELSAAIKSPHEYVEVIRSQKHIMNQPNWKNTTQNGKFMTDTQENAKNNNGIVGNAWREAKTQNIWLKLRDSINSHGFFVHSINVWGNWCQIKTARVSAMTVHMWRSLLCSDAQANAIPLICPRWKKKQNAMIFLSENVTCYDPSIWYSEEI